MHGPTEEEKIEAIVPVSSLVIIVARSRTPRYGKLSATTADHLSSGA